MSDPSMPPPYAPPPPPYAPPPAVYGAQPYASWGKRVLAYLVDLAVVIPLYVVGGIFDGAGDGGSVMGALCSLAAVGVIIWNQVFKQGATGQSIGKGVVGIKLIGEATGAPLGAGKTFLRALAHFLDALPCYLGYFWPLWDDKRQTFADKIMTSIVIEVPKG